MKEKFNKFLNSFLGGAGGFFDFIANASLQKLTLIVILGLVALVLVVGLIGCVGWMI